jgi:peptide/nickel transport system substrate-binding protein
MLNGSDSEYSNPAYDALYIKQAEAMNPADRKAIIDRMQQILYKDSPYAILWYNTNIQAFRTDRWTGYSSVPPSGHGAALRNMLRTTYVDLKPRTASTTQSSGRGSAVVIIAILTAAVIAVVVVTLLLRRRPQSVELE